MRLGQLQRPLKAIAATSGHRPALATFNLAFRPAPSVQVGGGSTAVDGRRYASVKSQGAYKIPNKKTLPKKLGAKKSGDQHCIRGNIIYKQRGTIWHPGENAIMGRDHTIHAAVEGYVKYYRDPARHPERQYIGVAFNRDDKLPYPIHSPCRRKLGMVALTRKVGEKQDLITASGIPRRVVKPAGLYTPAEMDPKAWARGKKNLLAKARQESMAEAGAAKVAEQEMAMAAARAVAAAAAQAAAATGQNAESKKKAQKEFVHPLTFIQNRWQERRRTRVLHLDKRNYSYVESNAAIGRLAGRNMYTAPWKLGGRKARFRARRRRLNTQAEKEAEEREMVRQERIREQADKVAKAAAKAAKAAAKLAAQTQVKTETEEQVEA